MQRPARPSSAAIAGLRLVCLVGSLLAGRTVLGGQIDPSLMRTWQSLPADAPVRALVFLQEQAPLARASAAAQRRGASRAELHTEGVQLLQAATSAQAPLLRALDEGAARGEIAGYRSYWIVNCVAVTGRRDALERIAARGDVVAVEPVLRPQLVEPVARGGGLAREDATQARYVPDGIRAIRAPQVWHQFGLTGEGTLVANFDTGVDVTHPALGARWRGADGTIPAARCWFDLVGSSPGSPIDRNGHGTHVMGTITGRDAGRRDTIGVAPDAQWIAAASRFNGSDLGFRDEVIEAFQWFADPDGDPLTIDDVPDVIQNSWGLSGDEAGYSPCNRYWWNVIDACEAIGIITTWSAGNEGPGAPSLIVPADRASSPTNTFSIGAVAATGTIWPYSIANFSSRGPTQCIVPRELLIKPEVVAPGVDVYSSVPGGSYQSGWSGTSMAGPHVAGIFALMRQANPDLPVEDAKRIVMETARDLGAQGEDNTFGYGFVDAFAAVEASVSQFGRVSARVLNASVEDRPIPGAVVTEVGRSQRWRADERGRASLLLTSARHLLHASADGFDPDTTTVEVTAHDTTDCAFRLLDRTGPTITAVEAPHVTLEPNAPVVIRLRATDPSDVPSLELRYRRDDEPETALAMEPEVEDPAIFRAVLPPLSFGREYHYRASALDRAGNGADWPASPEGEIRLVSREVMASTEFEEATQSGWSTGGPDETASAGFWVWSDPVGTREDGRALQPEDDATLGPGRRCFVTANGLPGDRPGSADVDSGCVVLQSPSFDLSRVDEAWLLYQRWYGEGGATGDDTLRVEISSDGGATWRALEHVADPDTVWQRIERRIDGAIHLTSNVRFRWRACDLHAQGVTEAAIDDFRLETFTRPRPVTPPPPPPPAPPARTRLLATVPNPATTVTSVKFELSRGGTVRVELFDLVGRRLRTIFAGDLPAGPQEVGWDGRAADGRLVSNGSYFVRLTSPDGEDARRLDVLR